MALDALSKFSSLFYSKYVNLDIKFGQNKKILSINAKNRLLIQSFKMENMKENQTNTMNIDIEGYGTGMVQLIMKYSVFDDQNIKAKNNSGIYFLTCDLKTLLINSNLVIYLPAMLILSILIVGEFVLDLNSRSFANIIFLNISFIFPATVISLIG